MMECSVVERKSQVLQHLRSFCGRQPGFDGRYGVPFHVTRPLAKLKLGDALCRIAGIPLGLHTDRRSSHVAAAKRSERVLGYERCYCTERNRKAFKDTLLRSSEKFFYYCTNCSEGQKHCVFVTNKTVKRYWSRGVINCRRCNRDPSRSVYEVVVEQILKSSFPDLEYFLECRAIRGFKGTIDFTVFEPRVLIQVDGPGHFNKPYKFRKASKDQPKVDGTCNDKAVAQGWHILRIHYKDIDQAPNLINLLLEEARGTKRASQRGLHSACGRVFHSDSYGVRGPFTE